MLTEIYPFSSNITEITTNVNTYTNDQRQVLFCVLIIHDKGSDSDDLPLIILRHHRSLKMTDLVWCYLCFM